MTKDHHFHQDESNGNHSKDTSEENKIPSTHTLSRSSKDTFVVGHQSKFLTTSRMLQLFSYDVKAPTDDMQVIYIDGAWDLFHPAHVALLKVAREVRQTKCQILKLRLEFYRYFNLYFFGNFGREVTI